METKLQWRNPLRGAYWESTDGAYQIELFEEIGRMWLLSYPGKHGADDAYRTLRDAKAAAQAHTDSKKGGTK